jgi:hypothetical protein
MCASDVGDILSRIGRGGPLSIFFSTRIVNVRWRMLATPA